MPANFHPGEVEVQARVGVEGAARDVAEIIRSKVPFSAQGFLARQPFAVVGSTDAGGRVWASLVSGAPGFMQVTEDQDLRIDVRPLPGDPLARNMAVNPRLGVLVIEPRSRRRLRLNGTAVLSGEGIRLVTDEVYTNCNKYIQARDWRIDEAHSPGEARRSVALSDSQRRWIAGADTFFIASFHAGTGADASHRGGNPGFVRCLDSTTLVWPDYRGNNLFQTLGNISVAPQAGLLFMDFDNGATLQLTGSARILWGDEAAARLPGAERAVEYRVLEAIETPGASPLRWQLLGYFPFNPLVD